ncbi:MAG: hypothetical protein ACFBSC_21215 [Microcoleaceae cyanobacterium]
MKPKSQTNVPDLPQFTSLTFISAQQTDIPQWENIDQVESDLLSAHLTYKHLYQKINAMLRQNSRHMSCLSTMRRDSLGQETLAILDRIFWLEYTKSQLQGEL